VTRHYGDYGTKAVLFTYVRTGWAGVVAGVFGVALLYPMGGYTGGRAMASITNAILACAVVGTVNVAVYLQACRTFHVTPPNLFTAPITNRLRRTPSTQDS